jgi:hypothetical protein
MANTKEFMRHARPVLRPQLRTSSWSGLELLHWKHSDLYKNLIVTWNSSSVRNYLRSLYLRPGYKTLHIPQQVDMSLQPRVLYTRFISSWRVRGVAQCVIIQRVIAEESGARPKGSRLLKLKTACSCCVSKVQTLARKSRSDVHCIHVVCAKRDDIFIFPSESSSWQHPRHP